MSRIFIKHLCQLFILLAPVITLNWSLLNLFGISGGPSDPVRLNLLLFELTEPKQIIELKIRVVLVAFASILILLHDAYDYYLPRRDFKDFRALYLEKMRRQWRSLLIPEIRISILHARRRWYFPFVPIFSWTWNDGYSPYHRDANIFLTAWQGVCGIAFRKCRPQLVDMREFVDKRLHRYERWLPFNQFHYWPSQLSKTAPVKCVLSIPLLMSSGGPSPSWRPVGVIKLDTLTDIGAEYLIWNSEQLSNDFADDGKIVAYLRP